MSLNTIYREFPTTYHASMSTLSITKLLINAFFNGLDSMHN